MLRKIARRLGAQISGMPVKAARKKVRFPILSPMTSDELRQKISDFKPEQSNNGTRFVIGANDSFIMVIVRQAGNLIGTIRVTYLLRGAKELGGSLTGREIGSCQLSLEF
jgi:hypothetical protein